MLRVGSVPYLVGRPLDLGLEREPGIELVRRVPAELVAGLRASEIDVALVSSVELFRRPGYRYLAGLAVAGDGPVDSVQVFLNQPLAQVAGVALDPASRAAATLVRILFERPGARELGLPARAPRWIEVAPGGDARTSGADAWLSIGDAALRTKLAPDAPPAFDPCAAWCARTGLPFVFALWIVRPGAELGPEHVAAFWRAHARGRARRAELAGEAAREWQLPEAACRAYLETQCRHELGPEQRASLLRFRDEAAALDLARADLEPQAIEAARVA